MLHSIANIEFLHKYKSQDAVYLSFIIYHLEVLEHYK